MAGLISNVTSSISEVEGATSLCEVLKRAYSTRGCSPSQSLAEQPHSEFHQTDDFAPEETDKVNKVPQVICSHIAERLEDFITYFVQEFEAKIENFYDKERKSVCENGLGTLKKIRNKNCKVQNKNGLSEIITKFQNNKVEFKTELIEGAFEIFQSFEMQFLRVNTPFGSKFAMKLLAKDAVNRSIYYYSNTNKYVPIALSIVNGKSKIEPFRGIPIFTEKIKKAGFSVIDEMTNEKWATSDIFKKAGILVINGVEKQYWRCKNEKEKYGFRLLTSFESIDEIKYKFGKKLVLCEKIPINYDYKLILFESNVVVEYFLNKLNKQAEEEILNKVPETLMALESLEDLENSFQHFENIDDEEQIETESLKSWQAELRGGMFGSTKIRKIHSIRYQIERPIENFIGRQEEFGQLHNFLETGRSVYSKIIAIAGIGGVGKTQFVRKYIEENSEYYQNIIWIDAYSKKSIKNTFLSLAKSKFETIENENFVQSVFEGYSDKNCLYIFDNVEKVTILKKFLPKPLVTYQHIPNILITSRCNKWYNSLKIFYLPEWKQSEAVEFIQKEFENLKIPLDDFFCHELAENLQYHPFDIQQAILYITTKNVNICTFLNDLRNNSEILLNSDLFIGPKNSEKYFLFATFQKKLSEILENGEIGLIAFRILKITSFMSPNNIFSEIFEYLLESNDDLENSKLHAALDLLEKYSFIYWTENNIFRADKLVQKIVRVYLNDDEVESILYKIVKIILKEFGRKNIYFNYDISKRSLIFHLESLLKHIDQIINKGKRQYLEEFLVIDILMCLGHEYLSFQNYKKAFEFLERGLNLSNKIFGSFNMHSTALMYNLGLTYIGLNKKNEAEQILGEILPLFEGYCGKGSGILIVYLFNLKLVCYKLGEFRSLAKYFNDEKTLYALYTGDFLQCLETDKKTFNPSCLYKIGLCSFKLGNYHIAKIFYKNTLNLFEEFYGEDSLEFLINLVDLSQSHGKLNEFSAQKLYAKRAYNICMKFFNDNVYLSGWVMVNLAHAYSCCGEHVKALEFLEQASDCLNLNGRVYENKWYILYDVLKYKSYAYEAMHLVDKQLETLEEMLSLANYHYALEDK